MIRRLREWWALRGVPRVTDARLQELAHHGAALRKREQDRLWERIQTEINRRNRR